MEPVLVDIASLVLRGENDEIEQYLSTLTVTEKNKGPIAGFRTTRKGLTILLTYLREYYHYFTTHGGAVPRMKCGWITETENYGTSSVSMGIAVKLFYFTDQPIALLNCGTGGIKATIFKKRQEDGSVYCSFKLSTVNDEAKICSPNAVKIGTYQPRPSTNIPGSEEEVAEWAAVWNTDLQNRLLLSEALKDALVAQGAQAPFHIFPFITGPCRQHWEKSSASERARMELDAKKYFECFGITGEIVSYFISQENEGEFEQIAGETMYRNLANNEVIPENIQIFRTFGIGQGSTQWGSDCLVPVGMKNIAALEENVPNIFMKKLFAGTLTKAYEKMLTLCFDQRQIPVLVLKSGCALLLNSDANLRKLVYAREQLRSETTTASLLCMSCVPGLAETFRASEFYHPPEETKAQEERKLQKEEEHEQQPLFPQEPDVIMHINDAVRNKEDMPQTSIETKAEEASTTLSAQSVVRQYAQSVILQLDLNIQKHMQTTENLANVRKGIQACLKNVLSEESESNETLVKRIDEIQRLIATAHALLATDMVRS